LRDAKPVVGALLAAFLFITLIGCANIVHLVMAGAAARRRDAAIRVAVGASRIDVFRPAVLELGILFATGGALGLVAAYWGLKAVPSLLPPQLYIPRADALASQAPALLFASGASLVGALALGMGLSRGVYRPSVNDELRGVAAATVRDRVVRMLPGVSVEKLQTGSDILADATARSRFVSQQPTALALVALVLAGAGIYSVVSFRNSRRIREIAVRMALGSTRRQVVFLVVREALTMVAVGVAAGVPMAIGGGRVLTSLRYDARPLDVLPYLVATAIFCGAGLAAALPPARRAATVEPMEVLRTE
jgi:ABC-type antimicrobial peptide transport system permease subunit